MNNSGNLVNDYKQRAGNCIDFDWIGRYGNCQYYSDWQEKKHACKVCKGEFCENFRGELC